MGPRLVGTAAKTSSGNEKGQSGKPEVRALLPLSITGAERVHRVSTPVVPWPLCPDRREDGEEQWCGHDPALHLSPKHGSLVLVDHHAAQAIAGRNRERPNGRFAGAFVMSEVMSENVAKLIAILATFSRTGHNWAALAFSGNADLPGRMHTGHYQPDGTFTDWQSGGSRVRVPSPPPESPGHRSVRVWRPPQDRCKCSQM